jgi:flagellar M-ring protein FliF
MADIRNVTTSLQSMPPKKLVALVLTAAFALAGLVFLYSWSQKAGYQILYSNLSEEDAGQIIQKLGELKVPYSTSPGGIMVPADRVYELRLQLAGQGLPQGGGVGFELFDKTSFTMTDFVQKLNYRRALQGELSRTIRSLAEVEQCRVHLVVPEKSLFVQKEDRPKASVLVKLRPGRRLSQGQIQGIMHLVASSVEGLDPRNVSVVDSGGEMLTSAADEALTANSGQLDFQRSFEQDLESRVIAILEPVAGKGKVRAKVAASIDFTKIEKTEEKFDPDSQVVRSEQRNVEKSANQSGGPGGVPGVSSNLPGKTGLVQAGTPTHQSSSEKKSETVNYEITKVVSRIVSPSGEVKRLSVVALVDGVYATAQGSNEKKYSPRSEEDLRQFDDMVKKAVGFNAERGDEVKVVNLPFEPLPQEELAEEAPGASSVLPLVQTFSRYLVPLVGGILLFFFVVRPLMRSLTSSPATVPSTVQFPQSVAEIERTLEQKQITDRDQLVEWAKKNPRDATNLIKNWLEER